MWSKRQSFIPVYLVSSYQCKQGAHVFHSISPRWLLRTFILEYHTENVTRKYVNTRKLNGRSRWQRSLSRRSAAACLLRFGFESHQGVWISVCCECCVLSGRGLCEELITRPEESYRMWCVVVCSRNWKLSCQKTNK
jgi:hypothetical protein